MIGKNPLWVAKQHGHSVQTMLETYAAWLEGTTGSDLVAITRAMEGPSAAGVMARKLAVSAPPARPQALSIPPESPRAVSWLSTDREPETQVPDNWWKGLAEREGLFGPAASPLRGRPPGVIVTCGSYSRPPRLRIKLDSSGVPSGRYPSPSLLDPGAIPNRRITQADKSLAEREGLLGEAPRPFGAALRVLAKPTAPAFRHHGARYNEGLK
ncbi:MAG: hypothetical protein JWN85_2422, partial [Gammaproteobacteria bacterium]|nr:hypothetical protein [Gammaproteobacteria bacterium]